MKLLHTSDWHLGRSLYTRNRREEFTQFLNWLVAKANSENSDAILVAGDIFDTGTPPTWAQELYYKFLYDLSKTNCKHVVIIAGNHDSPTFIEAPKSLLKILNVHVIGSLAESLEDEVIVLNDKNNTPSLIVCAVPYLRDRDIRTSEAGESIDDKNQKILTGIKTHYSNILKIAKQKKQEYKIPIVAMGHLFTAGGKTIDDDGVRDLYIGSLAHINSDVFDSEVTYTALGHLHVPQVVMKKNNIRYSGSPIPMGFGESKQQKIILSVEIDDNSTSVKEINVPVFQNIIRIAGDLDYILSHIEFAKKETPFAWLEVEYTGKEIPGNLRDTIESVVENSTLEILRIKSNRVSERSLSKLEEQETLEELLISDVFNRCLIDYKVPDEQKKILTESFEEIMLEINEAEVIDEN